MTPDDIAALVELLSNGHWLSHSRCGLCKALWPCDGGLKNEAADALTELSAEVELLRRWKAEATEVIEQWERVWTLLGRPGELGESKPAASATVIAHALAEVELLRSVVRGFAETEGVRLDWNKIGGHKLTDEEADAVRRALEQTDGG